MRRLAFVATLAVLLLAAQGWAQMRGHIGVSGSRGSSFGVRPPAMGTRGTGFGFRGSGFGGGFRSGFGHTFFHGRFHHRNRFFFGAGFGFPFYGFYPAYGYPYEYGYDAAPVATYSYSPPAYDAYYADEQRRIEDRLDRLEDRIDRMRDQERYRREAELSQPKARGSRQDESLPAVLVFRDKHREEVQNYGIVGRTLWIFSEQRARKVSLTELDLPATTKANEERGLDFRVPPPGR